MAEQVAGLSAKVLQWARERAGLSVDDVALMLRKDATVIEGWERGVGAPTYSQLERIAYSLYKRPLALFFFPEPPEERDPKRFFRTLPAFELQHLSPDTLYAVREAQATQLALKELTVGVNPSERRLLSDVSSLTNRSFAALAAFVREYLTVGLDQQLQWRTADEALKAWRSKVEDSGIFVFKRSFKQKDVSGFCLRDAQFPVIVINNSTAKQRQIFSLFHELAHLLFDTESITKFGDDYMDGLPRGAKLLEQRCNAFSAALLVPNADFAAHVKDLPQAPDDFTLSRLANRYKVSRLVILRKYRDLHRISAAEYRKRVSKWGKETEVSGGEGEGGGDYYLTKASYLGEHFMSLAFGKYYQGSISRDQLADYLGVKVRSLTGLEELFMKRAAS